MRESSYGFLVPKEDEEDLSLSNEFAVVNKLKHERFLQLLGWKGPGPVGVPVALRQLFW